MDIIFEVPFAHVVKSCKLSCLLNCQSDIFSFPVIYRGSIGWETIFSALSCRDLVEESDANSVFTGFLCQQAGGNFISSSNSSTWDEYK